MKYENYIGVFDSGVGGISVLKELLNVLPNENYIFYGDTLNSPYGDKTKEEIIALSFRIVDYMIEEGVKAIVIACNTATSAAADAIREKYPDKIIIAIEPAIKPAIEEHPDENILVMATAATIRLDKFNELKEKLDKKGTVIPLACKGLADAIENEEDVRDLLTTYLEPYKGNVAGVVLGCTHYPFVVKEIKEVLGDVDIYNGAYGTAVNLKHQLENNNLISDSSEKGTVVFESSDGRENTYERFLSK